MKIITAILAIVGLLFVFFHLGKAMDESFDLGKSKVYPFFAGGFLILLALGFWLIGEATK